jgi:hypothetical protein
MNGNLSRQLSQLPQRLGGLDWRWATVMAIALGVVFRVAQYLANRSLWLDEVYLAMNIINRPFAELLRPLSDNQGAPIGFLFLERLVVQLGGTNEYALRAFPLLSGVASIFLFYLVAKHFLSRWAVGIALILFAVSEPLIYYSSEVKQYAFDVFIALCIYYAIIRVNRLGLSRLNLWLLVLTGVVSVWMSDPAVFVLVGAGSGLLLSSVRGREKTTVYLLAVVLVLWLASFVINYGVRLSNLASNLTLQEFWQEYFMPFPPVSLGDVRWFAQVASDAVSFLFQGSSSLLIGLVLALGLWAAFSRRIIWLLVAPIIFALLASGLHYYPFYQRFLLFALPSLILLCTLGIESVVHSISAQTSNLLASLVFVGLIALPPTASAFAALIVPRTHEEIRPVVEYFLRHRGKEDKLYVYYSAERPLEYYLSQFDADVPFAVGVNSRDNWMGYLEDLSRWRGKGRVWFLFSHVLKEEGVDEEKLFTQYLTSIGQRLDSFNRDGASAYLYDLK